MAPEAFFWNSEPMNDEIRKNLKFNYVVNVFDGAFFGFALGFASFSTVIPLFISTLTDSAILIGLVTAIHTLGWQLPQLFMARSVSRQKRYKPMVVLFTTQERLPFLGLALIAFFLPKIGPSLGLVLVFSMLAWQGLGGGVTASPWQVMIHKVIPTELLATFFGVQGAASSLLASAGAVLAGILLDRYPYPTNYAIVFGIACVWLVISWFFTNGTREPEHSVAVPEGEQPSLRESVHTILHADSNFVWLLISRILSQFGIMGFSFYAVYVVYNLGASETQAGLMTSVLMITQVGMNVILGWLADHWNIKGVLEIGFVAMGLSTLAAWLAPSFGWFFLVMVLTGAASTALWTIMMALTLQFGTDENRPMYVGMANTLIAPFTILAPLFGGWLANYSGYPTTFLASAICSVVAILTLHFLVHDPRKHRQAASPTKADTDAS
jgi:MFS family permease